jgi:two-component system, NtrC family, nitrogen regulation sensor histidine kinase NtrY
MKSFRARAAQMLAWPSLVDRSREQDSRKEDRASLAGPSRSRVDETSSASKPKTEAPSQSASSSRADVNKLLKRSRPNFTAKHDRRILLMSLASGFPAVVVALILLWAGDQPARVQWTLSVMIVGFWLGFSHAVRERVVFPLQTLSNLLAALREGDFSIRARGAVRDDPLGEAMLEVNFLGQILREQRLGALEATTLLRTVMAEIEVAIFAFDSDQKLKLVNRAGERLLAQPAERLIGRSATDLGLADCLSGDATRTLQMSFPRGAGRWEVHRSTFREHGAPHQLLVLSDLSRALREEERQAWQRLVRVLGHELNNSLAPIKSIAGSLESLVLREPQPPDWKEDMSRGLGVIAARAASLNRFMEAYSRLARLPLPRLQPLSVSELVNRVARLETRLSVEVSPGPEITVRADNDQLEQLLINLVRNAVDASIETGGRARIGWRRVTGQVEVWIEDEGPGLSNTSNLFVPFFTTKPAGSGIGLVLSRQIAEAHGGTLTLENRTDARGCEARLRLPI